MRRYLEKAFIAFVLVVVLLVACVFQKVLQIGLEEYAGLSNAAAYFISLFFTLFVVFFISVEKDDKDNRNGKG